MGWNFQLEEKEIKGGKRDICPTFPCSALGVLPGTSTHRGAVLDVLLDLRVAMCPITSACSPSSAVVIAKQHLSKMIEDRGDFPRILQMKQLGSHLKGPGLLSEESPSDGTDVLISY